MTRPGRRARWRRRGALAALVAVGAASGACTLVNAVDSEAIREDCTNGQDDDADGSVDCLDRDCRSDPSCREDCANSLDDDEDGATDCDDTSCLWGDPRCFARLPLAARECAGTWSPELVLHDDFAGGDLSDARWQAFAPAGQAPPRAEGGLLLLAPEGPGEADGGGVDQAWAGVASRERFIVDAGEGWQLEADLVQDAPCPEEAAKAGRCSLSIELHTRAAWGNGNGGGASVLRISLTQAEGPAPGAPTLGVTCAWRGQEAKGQDDGPLPLGDGDKITLTAEPLPTQGQVSVAIDDREVCVLGVGSGLQPPATLVLSTPGSPGLSIRGVSLRKRAEVAGDCEGVRSPVVRQMCDWRDPANGGVRWPRVVATPAGYHMLAVGTHVPSAETTATDTLLHLVSGDGRDWDRRAVPSEADEGAPCRPSEVMRSTLPVQRLGAALHRRGDNRESWVEAWIATRPGAELLTQLVRTPAEGQGDWQTVGTAVRLEGTQPGCAPGTTERPWLPQAVVTRDDGPRYEAWYENGCGDGGLAYATSEDGLAWTEVDGHVVGPDIAAMAPAAGSTGTDAGDTGAWQPEALTHPAVVWTGAQLVMAYMAESFGRNAAIGLAASQDGRTWTHHPDNPLDLGSVTGLAREAAEPGTLVAVGDGVLRLYYGGVVEQAGSCPASDERSLGPAWTARREIGLVEVPLFEGLSTSATTPPRADAEVGVGPADRCDRLPFQERFCEELVDDRAYCESWQAQPPPAGELTWCGDVRPILARRGGGACVGCHGEQRQEGAWRVDSYEAARTPPGGAPGDGPSPVEPCCVAGPSLLGVLAGDLAPEAHADVALPARDVERIRQWVLWHGAPKGQSCEE